MCDVLRVDEEMVSHMTNAVVRGAELCYDNYGSLFRKLCVICCNENFETIMAIKIQLSEFQSF